MRGDRAVRLAAAALALAAGAAPARAADDVRYAGRLVFESGLPTCPAPPAGVTMEVGSDGGIRGSVAGGAAGATAFFGTVDGQGRLSASYRAAAGIEPTRVEGRLVDGRFDGVARSHSCRYRIEMTRRGVAEAP